MKKIIFIISLLICSSSFAAQSESFLLRLVKKTREYALTTLISERCFKYMPYDQQFECQKTVKQNIENLDSDLFIPKDKEWTPKSFVFVAFKSDLLELLEMYQTSTFLEGLNAKLNAYLIGSDKTFNVWEYTLKHYNGHVPSAAKAMAVLFQDTSPAKLHVIYLEKKPRYRSTIFNKNFELLTQTLSTIDMVLDMTDKTNQRIFYPREFNDLMNRSIYHFYVPLHMAQKLKAQGVEEHLAFTAPFLLTITYEFITAGKDERYFFEDPEKLEDVEKIKDIYAGLSGAHFGALGTPSVFNFKDLKQAFFSSTRQGVEQILWWR